MAPHQPKNITNFLFGTPLTYPSLGSCALDKDDSGIVSRRLPERSKCHDSEIVRQHEEQILRSKKQKYAFSFIGGRVGLIAGLYACGLKPGDGYN
jgi:hypothetical protein